MIMMTTTHRTILLLAFSLLSLSLMSLGQPAWRDWRNGVPKALQVETAKDGSVAVTVIGTHRWDTDVTQALEGLPVGTEMAFSATVVSDRNAWCYLSVKAYRNGREQRRTISSLNRRGRSRLTVRFTVQEGETIHALLRTHCGDDFLGSTARFSHFAVQPASELTTATQPPFAVEPGHTVCSLYLNGLQAKEASQFSSTVEFREIGGAWQPALPLNLLFGEGQAASSLVKLTPNTRYQVRVSALDHGTTRSHEATFTTLGAPERVVRTIILSQRDMTPYGIVIRDTPTDGYVRYTTEPGTILTAPPTARYAIQLDGASRVILDRIAVRGGRRFAIAVLASDHIVIRNCDIAAFGVPGTQELLRDGLYFHNGKSLNNDAGIGLTSSSHLLVENNYIHDPQGTANSWVHSHPAGPNAIFASDATQATIRFNDCIGGPGHRWNDAIEGQGNGSRNGSFAQDAEIYGNYLAFGNDDGIELDGGQQNCRFFRNKSEGLLCGVSTAPCLVGPSYLFENLICDLGDQYGLRNVAFKNNFSDSGKGPILFANNTIRTGGSAFSSYGGSRGRDGSRYPGLLRGTARNNLIDVSGSPFSTDLFSRHVSSFDHDLIAVRSEGQAQSLRHLQETFGQERHALAAIPSYANADGHLLALAPNSAGHHAGQPIPNLMPGPDIAIGAIQPDSDGLLPFRPLPFTLSAAHLEFTLPQDARPRAITLLPSPNCPKLELQIRIPDCADFIRVSPERATIAAGQPVTLTVSIDPTRLRQARRHSAAFVIRTDSGLSRPVSVIADNSSDLALVNQGRLGAIHGDAQPLGGGQPGLALTFDVAEEGLYFLFVRFESAPPRLTARSPLDKPDATPRTHLFTAARAGHPRWALVGSNTYAGTATHPVRLAPGRHTFTLCPATSGERLPRLLDCTLHPQPSSFLNAPTVP